MSPPIDETPASVPTSDAAMNAEIQRRLDALLVTRGRVGLVAIVAAILVFSLSDWVTYRLAMPALHIAHGFTAALCIFVYALLRTGRGVNHLRSMAVFAVAVMCVGAAFNAATLERPTLGVVIQAMIVSSAAGLMPWGVSVQIRVILVAVASYFVTLFAAGGMAGLRLDTPAVVVLGVGYLFTGYVSYWIHEVTVGSLQRELEATAAEARAREAQAQAQASAEKLERRVAERTQELENIVGELESFSYTVSHDLRQPLRTVDGFLDLMQAEVPAVGTDETAKGYMRRIRGAVGRMDQMISGLLQLSRLARRQPSLVAVDLAALVRPLVEELRASSPRDELEVRILDVPSVIADPDLMTVLLQNLLENAWKFTGETDGARIEFGADAGDSRDSSGPEFYVRDNGAGFDGRFAAKLFEAFQRDSDHSGFVGTGIGLATVRRIVDLHGGRVWATGTPGEGAEFRFRLGTAHRQLAAS